jgi:uncharacterized alpha/beta hydrolase family protein
MATENRYKKLFFLATAVIVMAGAIMIYNSSVASAQMEGNLTPNEPVLENQNSYTAVPILVADGSSGTNHTEAIMVISPEADVWIISATSLNEIRVLSHGQLLEQQ